MTTVIRAILGGGGGTTLALAALIALLAAALLTLAPAAADGHPADLELVLSLAEDSDNIVPPGGEFTVEAALRFTTPHTQERRLSAATGSSLRLVGELNWEGSDFFKRLNIAEHMVMGGTPLTGVDAAGAALGSTARMVARAADGRLIVARGNTNKLYLFDAWNKRQVGIIDAPAGAHASTFGGATTLSDSDLRGVRSVATWQQDEDTWWVFAGSRFDTVGAYTNVGRLYVFRVDWTAAGLQVGAPTIIHPSADEYRNRHSAAATDTRTEYGYSLNISRDGSTLAVAAPYMNHMGAVYIYSRPDGEGRDWSDITHADAVKATPAVVPAWGTGVDATRPFTPTSTGRTDASADCDAWCSAVWAEVDIPVGNNWSPPHRIGLSADGRVIAVGRPGKRYASTTPGGSFSSPKNYTGEIQVYAAPVGGWSAAPRADAGGRTLFATRTDASGFKPAQHYSAGPLRRVAATSAKLTILPWADTTGGHYFGLAVDVSNDGTVVVSSAFSPGYTHVFQLDPGEEWSGDMVYTARLQDTPIAGNNGGVEFSGDDRTIAIGNIDAYGQAGEIYIYTRPANGVWVTAERSHESARTILSPEGRIGNRWWGEVLYDLGGERLIISAFRHAGGALWLSDSGCTQRVAEDLSTWTCPITLADARVVVPKGTPDGVVTISGSVAVSLSGLSGNATTVRDTLEVTIGEVDELAKVEFDFDTNAATGRPHPAVVAPGGATTLLLKLLNEHGKASAKGAILSASVTTTSQGGLSARLGSASAEACAAGGGRTCRIANPTTALTAGNADQIRLTMTHPGAAKAGAARVWALVIDSTGETFQTEPITVTFSGPPAALAIAQPPTALLGYAPTESADQRNAATLVVSAADAAGNKATVPTTRYSAKLTDPDGKTVAAGKAQLVWPLREGNAADGALLLSGGNPQARVTILAARSAPLASGEYTLELKAGSGRGRLTATQTVVITGGAAQVALSADPAGPVNLDDTVTLTATVTDSSGAPVPDGTPVAFAEQSTGANVTLVLLSQSEQRTRDGRASASLRAVGVGGAYVTAEADDQSDAYSITVAAPPPPPLDDAIAVLAVDTYSIWTDPRPTTAAELYAQLEGVAQLSKWDGIEWLRYGETNGLLTSGSVDFPIRRGEVLWLTSE